MRGSAPVPSPRTVITEKLLGALVQIDSPAEVGLRVHRAGSSQCRLLPVDISNNGAAVLVTVGKANAPPPYRIENRWGCVHAAGDPAPAMCHGLSATAAAAGCILHGLYVSQSLGIPR